VSKQQFGPAVDTQIKIHLFCSTQTNVDPDQRTKREFFPEVSVSFPLIVFLITFYMNSSSWSCIQIRSVVRVKSWKKLRVSLIKAPRNLSNVDRVSRSEVDKELTAGSLLVGWEVVRLCVPLQWRKTFSLGITVRRYICLIRLRKVHGFADNLQQYVLTLTR
jgi:hypothetical protein